MLLNDDEWIEPDLSFCILYKKTSQIHPWKIIDQALPIMRKLSKTHVQGYRQCFAHLIS
jgi:hypothetical protein